MSQCTPSTIIKTNKQKKRIPHLTLTLCKVLQLTYMCTKILCKVIFRLCVEGAMIHKWISCFRLGSYCQEIPLSICKYSKIRKKIPQFKTLPQPFQKKVTQAVLLYILSVSQGSGCNLNKSLQGLEQSQCYSA
jgi:hypothetical protein